MTTTLVVAYNFAFIVLSNLLILLFVAYFGAVAAYFILQTPTTFRIWEFLIMLSGPVCMLFIVSVLEDAQHNTYWVLCLIFTASSMLTTMLAHYENIMTNTLDVSFQTNDSLAWGILFGTACLFASLCFSKEDKSRKSIRTLFIIIGILCFAGLLGPITHIDYLWFIAVAGYGPGLLVLCVMQMKYLINCHE